MSSVEREDLIIPIYLNQRVVFDQVAMLKNGISTVTQISRKNNDVSSVGGCGDASFNLSEVLSSLLKINVSGKISKDKSRSEEEAKTEERIHTPSSLFFEYRKELISEKYIVYDSDEYVPKIGDFVEFQSSIHITPLVDALNSLVDRFEFVANVIEEVCKIKKHAAVGKNDDNKMQTASNMKKVIPSIKIFLTKLVDEKSIDIITDTLKCKYKVLAILEKSYLEDKTISGLCDGIFRVLGKVTQVHNKGIDEVSLIRKTSISSLSGDSIDKMLSSFDLLAKINNPQWTPMKSTVNGPVFQIIPIAIYA